MTKHKKINMKPDNSFLVDGEYSFRDLVDINRLREIFEKFSQATGFTTGLVSFPEQELLISTGWRDICTKFHRAYPASYAHCKQSNLELTSKLKDLKELNIRPCENGLVDGATPIIIEGVHIASLFSGQMLFDEPDAEWFRKQSEKYGYDADAYNKALKQVPVTTRDEFRKTLAFLNEMAVIIAEQGLMKLRNLKGSEKKYQLVLDNANVAIQYYAIDGTIRLFNRQAAKNMGGKPKDFVGKSVFELLPDLAEEYRRRFREVARTGEGIEREDVTELPSGTRWFWSSLQPVKDLKDEITGIQIFSTDITERVQAEEKIKESEERYRSLVNKIQAAVVVHDSDTKVITCNIKAQELLGLTENQMLGKTAIDPAWKFFREDGEIMPYEEYPVNQVLTTRKPLRDLAASIYLPRKVDRVWVFVNADPVFDSKENIQQVIVTFMDITERKNAELALRESEQKYSALFHDSNDGIFIHDLDGNLIDANQKALDLFGYTKSELLSIKLPMLHPTEAHEKSKFAFETIKRKGYVRFEIDFIKKNGEVLSTEVSSSLLEINDRKVVQGIVTDVTERKETEEKLRQQATADPLTGIFNRRHFFELAEKELARSRRYSRPLSVLIFDIDHFKKVNDTYGHAVGDQALCTLVAECQAGLRENDVFARYGGEEFIILLPESDLEQAGQMAERIRMRLAGTAPLEVGAASVPLTASFGVSSLDDESLSLDELILRADSALYDAKEAGRNRVSVWCQTASGNTE